MATFAFWGDPVNVGAGKTIVATAFGSALNTAKLTQHREPSAAVVQVLFCTALDPLLILANMHSVKVGVAGVVTEVKFVYAFSVM